MLTPITPPSGLPLTLAEAKLHLRVDGADEDALIMSLIRAAVGHLQHPNGILGRSLLTQTWRITLDGFPENTILLPLPPLVSVTSVAYLDALGAAQTLSPTAYRVTLGGEQRGFISRSSTMAEWPETLEHPEAVTVQFVAGYGGQAASVPETLRQAMLLIIADLYANREGQAMRSFQENPTLAALLSSHQAVLG